MGSSERHRDGGSRSLSWGISVGAHPFGPAQAAPTLLFSVFGNMFAGEVLERISVRLVPFTSVCVRVLSLCVD